jgi:nucleoside-diphosphate-sugar epimerase
MSLVLLTGATGFVGRQVVESLARQRVEMRLVLRRPIPHWLDQIPGIEIKNIIISSDIFAEDISWWENSLKGVDTVIHIAWFAEPGKYLQSEINLDCLAGTLRLAQGCVKAKVRRFVGIGTCFEYDLTGNNPIPTSTNLRPLSIYAASKASTYLTLSQIFSSRQIEFVWCRLFYLYGDGERAGRLASYLHEKLKLGEFAELTSGSQVRDFLDVKEAGRMIAEIARSPFQGVKNICSGIPVTVKQLAERIADQYGRRDLLKLGAKADNLFDPPFVVGIKE